MDTRFWIPSVAGLDLIQELPFAWSVESRASVGGSDDFKMDADSRDQYGHEWMISLRSLLR